MKLQTLLQSIKQSQNTKTASETETAAPVAAAPTETKLAAALRDAVSESTKVASDASKGSPVAGVMKVAAEIADAEQEAAVKEAALLGAAFADSAVARFGEWQKAAGELPVPTQTLVSPMQKMASAVSQMDQTFAKYAEENPIQARQAISLGYEPTAGGLEKMAQDSYVQGYNDQVSEIHKVAQDEFLKAASLTSVLVQASQRQG